MPGKTRRQLEPTMKNWILDMACRCGVHHGGWTYMDAEAHLGRLDEAEALLLGCYARLESILGKDHRRCIKTAERLLRDGIGWHVRMIVNTTVECQSICLLF